MRDFFSDILAVKSINPILGNNTSEGAGTGVDLQGFKGALMLAHIGQSGDTLSGSVYIMVKFQECDTDTPGSYADIADADLSGGANAVVIDAAAEDELIVQRGYIGSKRWVRVLLAFTGTHTNGTPISAAVIKGLPAHGPAQ